jgi:hypothetical protein
MEKHLTKKVPTPKSSKLERHVQMELGMIQHTIDTMVRTMERTNEALAVLNDRLVEIERKYYELVRKRRP